MAINDLISKIILQDEFSNAFNDYNNKLDEASGRSDSLARGVGIARASMVALAGAATTAVLVVRQLTDAAVENEAALRDLSFSADAANREFGNVVGSSESWLAATRAMGNEFRVFTEKDLAAGNARLVTMTKRLGLTEEQMQAVARRTADLAALKGITYLEAIERTSSALRGEAESAEYLGLSLNETTVMAYAEAHGILWKHLDDNQKAQLRLALMMEQTEQIRGAAIDSLETQAGREKATSAALEEQAVIIGEKLMPARIAWNDFMLTLLEGSEGLIYAIYAFSAANVAAFSAFLDTLQNVKNNAGIALEALKNGFDAFVSGENPLEAMKATVKDNAAEWMSWGDIVESARDKFGKQLDFTLDKFEQTKTETVALTDANYDLATSHIGITQAASAMIEELGKIGKEREALVKKQNERLADLEYSHGVRVQRIVEDIERAKIEAAAEAAEARIQATADLAASITDIEDGLALDRKRAEEDLQRDRADIKKERVRAERDAAEDIRVIDRELKKDVEALEYDTARDRLKIIEDFEKDRADLVQDYADKRKAVEEGYADTARTGDAFARQQARYNADEQLKILERQEQEELAGLEKRKSNAITTLEDEVAYKKSILEREAEEQRERVRLQLAEAKEANRERLEDLKESFDIEQERRAENARLSIEKLKQQHAEELVRIDEQEAAKNERAEETLARENQNYADSLAALRRSNSLELEEVTAKYSAIEMIQQASYDKQIENARAFAAVMSGVLAVGAAPGMKSGGDYGVSMSTPGSSTAIYVDARGNPGGYAAGTGIGRTVADAVEGF